jgi:DUF1016 N-terminal domain
MKKRQMSKPTEVPENYEAIRTGIVQLLRVARNAAARNVNSLMTAAYWEIGRRIVHSEQDGESRAEYGEQLIRRLALELSKFFGRGFGARNLAQMRSFYLAWPEDKILQTVSAKSSKSLVLNKVNGDTSSIEGLAQRRGHRSLRCARRRQSGDILATELLQSSSLAEKRELLITDYHRSQAVPYVR